MPLGISTTSDTEDACSPGWKLGLTCWVGREREVAFGLPHPAHGYRFYMPMRLCRLEVTLLLERREIPVLWLLDHLRGRRDRLIIKATLRSPRQGELDVSPLRRGFLEPTAVDYRREPSWAGEEGPHGLLVVHRGRALNGKWPASGPGYKPTVVRVAVLLEKSDPHIQMHLDLARWATTSSRELLEGLRTAISVPHMSK